MRKRHSELYENDPTPSRVAVEQCRAAIEDDDSERLSGISLVTYRGGSDEFAIGAEYAASADSLDRAVGIRILGQLGWGDRTFLDKSVRILIAMLDDPDEEIIAEAATALGHRGDPSAIPALIKLSAHANSSVRRGVTYGLLGHEDPAAINALVKLAADKDGDVRDWATFGLGTQIDADTPELRSALWNAVADPDHEIRGEALVGLARRADPRVVQALLREWDEQEDVSLLSLEAAGITRDPRLYGRLQRFAEEMEIGDDVLYLRTLHAAVARCQPTRSASP